MRDASRSPRKANGDCRCHGKASGAWGGFWPRPGTARPPAQPRHGPARPGGQSGGAGDTAGHPGPPHTPAAGPEAAAAEGPRAPAELRRRSGRRSPAAARKTSPGGCGGKRGGGRGPDLGRWGRPRCDGRQLRGVSGSPVLFRAVNESVRGVRARFAEAAGSVSIKSLPFCTPAPFLSERHSRRRRRNRGPVLKPAAGRPRVPRSPPRNRTPAPRCRFSTGPRFRAARLRTGSRCRTAHLGTGPRRRCWPRDRSPVSRPCRHGEGGGSPPGRLGPSRRRPRLSEPGSARSGKLVPHPRHGPSAPPSLGQPVPVPPHAASVPSVPAASGGAAGGRVEVRSSLRACLAGHTWAWDGARWEQEQSCTLIKFLCSCWMAPEGTWQKSMILDPLNCAPQGDPWSSPGSQRPVTSISPELEPRRDQTLEVSSAARAEGRPGRGAPARGSGMARGGMQRPREDWLCPREEGDVL
ncbi:uncharacterized protein LOC141952775 [Strix uralensis]|uniref:uncharacterized protein LOC141952775 n=1 Tax=Strix uralensis TaxID=36305 RepID=UPI003DA7A482